MDYTEPQDINGQTAEAAEVTLTIYSGYAGVQPVITATGIIIPLHKDEENYIPLLDATSNATERIDADTDPELLPFIALIEQGIRGLIKYKYGYPV